MRFEALRAPTQGEVERLLRRVHRRVLRLLERRGALPAQEPENALQAYQAHSLQQRLFGPEVEVRPPPRKQPRCAVLGGFSLHANTHLHANDRQGLERLCRYGARGALALTRLSRAEDGRIAWRMKRPRPDGTWHLYFTGLELIRRTASLIPPHRVNLTRYHGVFALGAKLKPRLRPGQQGPEASQAKAAAPEPRAVEHARKRPPRLDWAGGLRRTFALEGTGQGEVCLQGLYARDTGTAHGSGGTRQQPSGPAGHPAAPRKRAPFLPIGSSLSARRIRTASCPRWRTDAALSYHGCSEAGWRGGL